MDEDEIDYESLWDDEEFMPDMVTAGDVNYAPMEHGYSRLEIRDPDTHGRHAWGYVSEDEVFIMNDSGEIYIKWDHTTTSFRQDLSDAKWVTSKVEGSESFEGQQDRMSLLLSRLKFARVAPQLRNRLERWLHASRFGHWLRTR
jgi:hypothetical protein